MCADNEFHFRMAEIIRTTMQRRNRASASGLSRGVNASDARAGADATAHYRNRRFYWLRAKLNTQPLLPQRKENESEKKRGREKETRNDGETRGTVHAIIRLCGTKYSGCTLHQGWYKGAPVSWSIEIVFRNMQRSTLLWWKVHLDIAL